MRGSNISRRWSGLNENKWGQRKSMLHSISKTEALSNCKVLLIIALVPFFLTSCNVSDKRKLGVVDSQLTPCPSSPNCATSDTNNTEQKVEPFALVISPEKAWDLLIEHVAELPRTVIVRKDSRYLYAECRSQFFGFVDDLEFHLRPEQKIVAVRSASRVGYYDFGVNRSRIEKLRLALRQAKAVQ